MPAAPIRDAACPTSPELLIEMICPGASFTLCTFCTFMPRSSPARPLPQQIGLPRKWYSTPVSPQGSNDQFRAEGRLTPGFLALSSRRSTRKRCGPFQSAERGYSLRPIAASLVLPQYVGLGPASFEVRPLLLHLVEQAIDHGANQRERADGLPVDVRRGLFRHCLPPVGRTSIKSRTAQ